jgi:shikimate dehydrogenase
MRVSGRTRIVGIIGDPVAHSLSPAMHNAAFGRLGLDFTYVPFHVRPAQLGAAIAGIRALGLVGVNVTVPHKERVIDFLDTVSARAQRAGAVNTILNHGGRLHGENTDIIGFQRALSAVRFRLRGARVLVVGAGGAARAVLTALHEGGARSVTIANRTTARARALAIAFGGSRLRVDVARLAALRDVGRLAAFDLVVNATSVGLHGEPFVPLSYGDTPARCLFADLLYGRRTDFLCRADRAGRPTLDGLGMLLHQGAAAFSLWTGRRAPIATMRRALHVAMAATGPPRRVQPKIDKEPGAK